MADRPVLDQLDTRLLETREVIRSFVKQARGAMSIRIDRGTTVTIRFPKGFNRRGRND